MSTDTNSEPPPNDPVASGTDPASSTVAADQGGGTPVKGGSPQLRPTLLGGLTALIAALTAIATVNGSVARMFRNHPGPIGIAVILVLLAFLCGLLSQISQPRPGSIASGRHDIILAVGSIALVFGMAFGLIAQVQTTSLGDRPIIAATTKATDSNTEFHAQVRTQGARAHDQLIVTIFGLRSDGSRAGLIYYAKVGPDAVGDFSQDIQLEPTPAKTPGLYLTAIIVPEGIFPELVDCDGNIVDPTGQLRLVDGRTVPFHAPDYPLVACLQLQFP